MVEYVPIDCFGLIFLKTQNWGFYVFGCLCFSLRKSCLFLKKILNDFFSGTQFLWWIMGVGNLYRASGDRMNANNCNRTTHSGIMVGMLYTFSFTYLIALTCSQSYVGASSLSTEMDRKHEWAELHSLTLQNDVCSIPWKKHLVTKLENFYSSQIAKFHFSKNW